MRPAAQLSGTVKDTWVLALACHPVWIDGTADPTLRSVKIYLKVLEGRSYECNEILTAGLKKREYTR